MDRKIFHLTEIIFSNAMVDFVIIIFHKLKTKSFLTDAANSIFLAYFASGANYKRKMKAIITGSKVRLFDLAASERETCTRISCLVILS